MREKLAKVKKGLGIAIFVIIAVLIAATVVASVFSKSRNKPIFVFGNTFLWVETESMEPTIEARSFISAKKYDGKGVKQGDIITFICTDTSSEVYGRLITHRVEKVVDGGYKTKGDNSLSHTDPWTVKDDDIVAVYGGNLKIFTFVGRVFLFPAGLILIVATFIFSCAFIYIPDMINAVKESDGSDGKSEKEKEIDRRVREEVEKMLKNDRSDGDEKTKPKYIGTIAFLIAVAVCIFFTAHAGALVNEYARTINEQAAKRAMFYADEVALGVRETCDDFRREVDFVAEKLSECVSERETAEELKKLYLSGIASDTFLTVFYLKDGEFINPEGQIVSGYSELNEIKKSENDKLTHVFQYDNKIMTIAAFTRTSGGYADGAVVLFDRAYLSLNIFREDGKRADDDGAKLAEFVALIRHDGKPLDKLENSDVFTLDNDTLQNGVLKEYLSGKDTDEFVRAIANGNDYSFVFRKGTDDYALALVSLGEENGFIAVAAAYNISVIYGEGYGVAQSIWAAVLGLAVVMAVLTVSMIIGYVNSKRRIYRLEMIDSTLNCATPKKFEKDAESILARHKNINFALVSLKISNFNYVNENFGDTASDNLAAFAVGIVKHALLIDETFAYAGDGELLLLLYYKDRKSFTDRLNGLYLRLARYEGLKDRDYTVSASFAVYEIEKDIKQTIKDCMNKLKTVKDASGVTVGSFSVNFYEDMLREKSVRKAEIEGKMENALENNEFHLFYQPKYNLRTKKADGCEILIRWYDPKLESYRSPGVFLPVFEEDGFICKIDRFVFYKACENIAARVAATKIVYPVSVNVSRVTAIQPDFVDYYVRIKNKFNIKDGFITLEFTESFAFENYGFLSEIIEKLHKNGFLCSIDDFGTGYSSYNILKTVPVDEIKLDKFFLEKGVSEDRDHTLLKSVIEMIKKLGIKATQEGVETREDFDRLQSLGCDVIQGYFFAKPMKYTDYCEFIEKNFS